MRENLLPIRRDGIGVAHYDANRDLIHIPAQKEFDTYPEYVQAVTREIVRATGVPQRLNREGTMSSDKEKQARESLVEDLVSAHKLLEFGLPSKLKKTTIENVPSIIKHIKETPNYTENLFRDINRAVGMMKKQRREKKSKSMSAKLRNYSMLILRNKLRVISKKITIQKLFLLSKLPFSKMIMKNGLW